LVLAALVLVLESGDEGLMALVLALVLRHLRHFRQPHTGWQIS